jgi:uncharacterized protein (TIGR00369 family)
MLQMTVAEIERLLEEQFPQAHKFSTITSLSEEMMELHLAFREDWLRPGGTISGPTLMTLADTGGYFFLWARLGPVVHAVTTNLNIHFMRKPRAEDVYAQCRILKLGRQLAVVEVSMRNASSPELVAHATVTYSLPPEPRVTGATVSE